MDSQRRRAARVTKERYKDTGWQDEVIPVEHSIRFAKAHRAELHLLDGDHRLASVLDEIGVLFERFLVRVLALRASEG